MKTTTKQRLFLILLIVLCGGALYGANLITAPQIEKQAVNSEKDNLQKVLEDVDLDEYQQVEVDKDSKNIEKIFKVQSKEYYVFKMKVAGFHDGTTFMVAIDRNDTIVGFYAIENGDTEGIGKKILNPEFKDSMIGKKTSEHLDVITGATITSQPVIDAIKMASTYIAEKLN